MSLGTILGTVGAVVGAYFGGPVGAQIGAVAGSMIGNAIDPPKGTRTEGQKLTDLTTQTVSYATFLGTVYGTYMRAGNIFWAGKKKEREKVQESGGSKGGGGATATSVTYYYLMSFAIGLSDHKILGVKSMLINGTKVYTTDSLAEAGAKLTSAEFSGSFRIYNGDMEQPIDPTMEEEDGVGNVPNYGGTAYCMFTDLNLEPYGNAVPQLIQFEVVAEGAGALRQGIEVITVYSNTNGYITSQLGTSVTSIGEYYRNRFFMNNLMFRDVENLVELKNLPVVIDPIDLKSTLMPTQFYKDGIRYYNGYTTSREDVYFSFDYDIAKIYQYQEKNLILNSYSAPPAFSFNDSPGWRIYGSVGRLSNSRYALYINSRKIKSTFSDAKGLNEHADSIVSVSNINVANPADTTFYAVDYLLPQGKYFKGAVVSQDQTYAYIFYSDSNSDTLSTVYSAKIALYENKIIVLETSVFEDQLYFCGMGKPNFIYTVGSTTPERFDFCSYDNKYLWLIASKNVACIFENENNVWVKKGTINISQLSANDLNFFAQNGLLYLNDSVGSAIFSASQTIDVNKIYLSDVVADQLKQAGMTEDLYDVTEIAGIELDGYLVGSKASARSNIEVLCNAYFFDVIDSDGILKVKKRGRAPITTITSDDFIIENESSGEARSAFTLQHIQELSLPREVQIVYMNKESDYAVGAQSATRKVTKATNTQSFNMPLLMTDDKARQTAETILTNLWLERDIITFSTSFDFIQYEPTDVVNIIDYRNNEYTVRLVSKTEGDNGQIQWQAVVDQRSSYTQTVKGASSTAQKPQEISFIETTEIIPMNLPIIMDGQSDQNAYYLAVSAKTEGKWIGASTFKSLDSTNYSLINDGSFSSSQNTVYGFTSESLSSSDCFTYDTSSKIVVNLRDKNTLLTSRSFDDLQTSKYNYALVGNEVIQFANADLISEGCYELSGFIRGMHGTEIYANSHTSAEKFVLLDVSKIKTISQDLSGIDSTIYLLGVSIGQTLSKGDKKTFANNGQTIKPLAPYSFELELTNGDFLISWYRRARINAGWINNIDTPLDEQSENYIIEIYSDNTYTTVLNEYSVDLKNEFTYTTDMQIEDFGKAQTSIYSKVYQISSRAGRGFASIPKLQ